MKKNKVEILEIKNTITERKSSVYEIFSVLHTGKEEICKFENRPENSSKCSGLGLHTYIDKYGVK